MKNSATNLRALLGINAKSTPSVKVSPAQQAEIDSKRHWLEKGQFDHIYKKGDLRFGSSPTGRLPHGWPIDMVVFDERHMKCPADAMRAMARLINPSRLGARSVELFNLDSISERVTLKGRRPGLTTTVATGHGKTLSECLRGVSVKYLFDNAVKSLRLASIYDTDSELKASLVSNIQGIYHIANAPDGNPVLAEHIANWWEENKENYSLPANI